MGRQFVMQIPLFKLTKQAGPKSMDQYLIVNSESTLIRGSMPGISTGARHLAPHHFKPTNGDSERSGYSMGRLRATAGPSR